MKCTPSLPDQFAFLNSNITIMLAEIECGHHVPCCRLYLGTMLQTVSRYIPFCKLCLGTMLQTVCRHQADYFQRCSYRIMPQLSKSIPPPWRPNGSLTVMTTQAMLSLFQIGWSMELANLHKIIKTAHVLHMTQYFICTLSHLITSRFCTISFPR